MNDIAEQARRDHYRQFREGMQLRADAMPTIAVQYGDTILEMQPLVAALSMAMADMRLMPRQGTA